MATQRQTTERQVQTTANAQGGDTIAPLRDFVRDMTRLVQSTQEEAALLQSARPLLAALLAADAWLPEPCTRTHADYYRQYLLHCDPLERFSLVSFVWGPGQHTPIHDHGVWGLIGMLSGAETGQRFRIGDDGRLQPDGEVGRLEPGDIEAVSPTVGDIHQVANAYDDRASISVHLYGANIGAVARHVFDPQSGAAKPFVSGYSAAEVPNLWDRSESIRQQITR